MDAELASAFTRRCRRGSIEELPALAAASPLATPEERVRLVNRLADRNWREGNGGPFAAIVVDAASGALISVGVNVVLARGLSAMHAEMMALSLAQRALGRWDLGADGAELELVVNWRPCVMCYGADHVVGGAGAHRSRARAPKSRSSRGSTRGRCPRTGSGSSSAAASGSRSGSGTTRRSTVFRAFGASDAVVYNARGASEE